MFFATNLRHLRHLQGLTQEALAEKVGISLKQIGSYEEERATPKLEVMIDFAKFFSVSLEQLINWNLRVEEQNTLPQLKEYAEGERLRVLSISHDEDENEYIELVRLSDAKEYLNGYANIHFVANLPKCLLPNLPKDHTYRAFEVADSLMTALGNSIVVGEFVADWNTLNDGEGCVIVSSKTGITFRKIKNQIALNNTLLLEDTNGQAASFRINIEEVEEIWRFAAYVNIGFPELPSSVQDLQQTMLRLQEAVKMLKKQ